MKLYKYFIILIFAPILFITCDEEILSKIDETSSEIEGQDSRIDSLFTLIVEQQKSIDSLQTTIENLGSNVFVITGTVNSSNYSNSGWQWIKAPIVIKLIGLNTGIFGFKLRVNSPFNFDTNNGSNEYTIVRVVE